MQDTGNAARPTVLAVDDDPAVRDALSLALEDYCEVVLAPDGPRALELLGARHVDVVLLDLLMPDMHGLEVLPQILKRDPSLAVVVLTAVASIASVVQAMKLGAWNYLAKPWDDDELLDLVRRAANHRQTNLGVLIVSEDPVRLAPLQLALERHINVAASCVARALSCGFQPTVLVLEASLGTDTGDFYAGSLLRHFPSASVFVLSDTPYRVDHVVRAVLRLAGVVSAPTLLPQQVCEAIAFLVSNYREHLRVGDVARAVELSEDRLAHVFKEATGYAVREYLMRLRIAIARRLLMESHGKLDAIASRVGLADASTLSKTFLDLTGVRPGEFRRSYEAR